MTNECATKLNEYKMMHYSSNEYIKDEELIYMEEDAKTTDKDGTENDQQLESTSSDEAAGLKSYSKPDKSYQCQVFEVEYTHGYLLSFS